MSNVYYLGHTAEELDAAIAKVQGGYKDVSHVTATEADVVIGKTIVTANGSTKNGTLNTDDFYNDGYSDGEVNGYNTGYNVGYANGESDGYSEGYERGLEEATPTLQNKEVTPSTESQIVMADDDYDGLWQVIVNAIPQSYTDDIYQRGWDDATNALCPYSAELNHIESTGTQSINTGVYPNPNTAIEIDFQFTDLTAQQRLFGARGDLWFEIYINGSINYGFNYQNSSSNSASSGVAVDTNRHTIRFDSYTREFILDGAVVKSLNSYNVTATGNNPIWLFAPNATYGTLAKLKLYSCRIYESGVLVHNYIPVLDKSGVACLYDKITNALHHNVGSGTFAYA